MRSTSSAVRSPPTGPITAGGLPATTGEGGSHRRSGKGGSSGGGSSRERDSHRRIGGRGGGSGGGGHAQRSGAAGKGSRWKGGHGHSSSDSHGGHRGHSQGGAYGAGSSSASEDCGKGPEVTVVSDKTQAAPSLVDVASSAELHSRLSICDDRDKPMSSSVAHARTSAIDATAAAAEAKHISTVKRPYVTLPIKDINRVPHLPVSSSVNPTTRQACGLSTSHDMYKSRGHLGFCTWFQREQLLGMLGCERPVTQVFRFTADGADVPSGTVLACWFGWYPTGTRYQVRTWYRYGVPTSCTCLKYPHTTVYITPPLRRFSKLDCSTTKRVPIPNDTSPETSRQGGSNAGLCGTGPVPTVEISSLEHRSSRG